MPLFRGRSQMKFTDDEFQSDFENFPDYKTGHRLERFQ